MGQVAVTTECGGSESGQRPARDGRHGDTVPADGGVHGLHRLGHGPRRPGHGQPGRAVRAAVRARRGVTIFASRRPGDSGRRRFWAFLVALGLFFLIIQGAALFSAVARANRLLTRWHELFVGTERVQQGDFAHRIHIDSGDQLGELAASFNRHEASMEHSLHVQREKQRLEDELRIAREIQKSLLPTAPPVLGGPQRRGPLRARARVGGDYYDFFELGPRRLGVMIADVSGKGHPPRVHGRAQRADAVLSGRERSPRQLLIEANRLLSAHLDNRSFITMTYAVIRPRRAHADVRAPPVIRR